MLRGWAHLEGPREHEAVEHMGLPPRWRPRSPSQTPPHPPAATASPLNLQAHTPTHTSLFISRPLPPEERLIVSTRDSDIFQPAQRRKAMAEPGEGPPGGVALGVWVGAPGRTCGP